MTDPGWYYAQGDPSGTHRYWDGEMWQGEPVPVAGRPGLPPSPHNLPIGRGLGTAGQRLLARIIDGLIVSIPLIIYVFTKIDWDAEQVEFTVDAAWLVAAGVWGALYEIGFIAAVGATPGKMMMGLLVVQEDTNAMPPSGAIAAKRWTPALLGLIPAIGSLVSLGIGIASFVMIGNDPLNRSVFDRVAGTYVVKK